MCVIHLFTILYLIQHCHPPLWIDNAEMFVNMLHQAEVHGVIESIPIYDYSFTVPSSGTYPSRTDFEQSLGAWYNDQSGSDNFDWIRMHGSTSTSGTGPSRDHSRGTSSGEIFCIPEVAVLLTKGFLSLHCSKYLSMHRLVILSWILSTM